MRAIRISAPRRLLPARRGRGLCLAGAALVVISAVSALPASHTLVSAATCDETWVGSSGGDWNTATNWSPTGVPSATTNTCINDGSSTVTVVNEGVQARTLTVSAGNMLSMQESGGVAVLTLSGSMSNAGTIDMVSNGCCGSGDAVPGSYNAGAQVVIPSGSTLTNTGTIETTGCCQANMELTGSVINQGTVSVTHGVFNNCCNLAILLLDGSGASFDNAGAVQMSGGDAVLVGPSQSYDFVNDTGGSVSGSGQMTVDGGNTFTQGAGTTSGNPVVINGDGDVLDFTGSGASSFATFGSNTLSGSAIASGQTVAPQEFNSRDAVLTLSGSMSNAGTIDMVSTNCCGSGNPVPNSYAVGAQVVIPPGSTLTNTGTIETTGCCQANMELTGSVINQGTVSVTHGVFNNCCNLAILLLDGSNATFDNAGAVQMNGGDAVLVGPSQSYDFVNDTGGSVSGSGQMTVDGGNTFTQGAGTTSGNPVVINGDGDVLDFTGSGASSFATFGSNTLSGSAIASGQTVAPQEFNSRDAVLTLSGSMSNAGTIDMVSTNCCGSGNPVPNSYAVGIQVVIPPGSTLTNTGTIETTGCCQSNMELTGNVTNQGTVSVTHGVFNNCCDLAVLLVDGGGTFDNAGTVSVGSTNTFDNVDATLLEEPAGTFSMNGSGQYTQGPSATLHAIVNAGAPSWSQITNGTTSLAGTIRVTTIGLPAAGSTWPIIISSNSGCFASDLFDTVPYSVDCSGSGVTLVAGAATATATQPSTTSGTVTAVPGAGVPAGTPVYDAATVTGNAAGNAPDGSVTFYACSPATLASHSATTCDSTIGSAVGAPVSLSGNTSNPDTVFSSALLPGSVGTWCFAAYYSSDTLYTGSADTSSSECFTVTAPAGVTSQITPTNTTCSTFTSGTATTLSSITYATKGKTISQVSPGVFYYWVTVTVAGAGAQTFTVTQGTTYGPTTGSPYFVEQSGSLAYTGACSSLKTRISGGTASTPTVTVRFSAPAGGTYVIGLKYATGSVVGSGPAATTSGASYAYSFQTTGVGGSMEGLSLTHR